MIGKKLQKKNSKSTIKYLKHREFNDLPKTNNMNIFLTLDYELFLGGSTGSPENCLFKPMKHFTDMLNKYNIKTTIFVDAAYLLRMKQQKNKNNQLAIDFSEVCKNIVLLKNQGHNIQLHFHPQWLFSDYINGKWHLNTKYYKLSDLPREQAIKFVAESKELLEIIINKKITAFRAGGFSIQSFDNYIELFDHCNLIIDSSVLRGEYINSYLHEYDYRNIPQKSIYSFSSDVKIEDLDGKYKELSIASIPHKSIIYFMKNEIARNKFNPIKVWGEGSGVGYGNFPNMIRQRIKKAFREMNLYASLDSHSSVLLPYVYDQYSLKVDNLNFITIGHPKVFSEGSINNIEKFILKVKNKNKFTTCEDII